jgi:hypothetical protein
MQKKEYSGYLGDLSPEQELALKKFRGEVQAMGIPDSKFDDSYLLRFLRARKFDLAKTKEMWVNFIKWRKDNGVDEIGSYVFSEIEDLKKAWPHGYFRTDKLGRPIYIERTGQLKLKQLFKVTTEERLIKYWIQSYERLVNHIMPVCSKVRGQRIEQTCTILDLKGGSTSIMSKQVYDFVKLASSIGQNYYPESMGKMFIVNAPLLFSGVWAMMRPWIDEKTRAKIEIIGSKFEAKLLEIIPAENLPDFLGGKAKESEYGPNLTIEQGPWVNVPQEPKTISDEGAAEDEERKNETQEIADLKNTVAGMKTMGISSEKNSDEGNDSEGKQAITNDIPLNKTADESGSS